MIKVLCIRNTFLIYVLEIITIDIDHLGTFFCISHLEVSFPPLYELNAASNFF